MFFYLTAEVAETAEVMIIISLRTQRAQR